MSTAPEHRKYLIATAPRPNARHWQNATITWAQLRGWMLEPATAKETAPYLLGQLRATAVTHKGAADTCTAIHRNGRAVVYRSVLALDADNAQPELVDNLDMVHGWAALVHTTFNHSPESPRLRLLLPLSRDVRPEEYRTLAQWVMASLGLNQFDLTSAEPERFMYRPAAPEPERFEWWEVQGEPLNVDAELANAAAQAVEATAEDEPAPTRPLPGPAYEDLTDGQQRLADAELAKTIEHWRQALKTAEGWDEGQRDGRGRGWELLVRDAAWALAREVAAPWSPLDADAAEDQFVELLPEAMAAVQALVTKRLPIDKALQETPDKPGWLELEPFNGAAAEPEPESDQPWALDDAHLSAWMARYGLAGDWKWAGGLGWVEWDGRRWVRRRDEDAREVVRRAVITLNKQALDAGADRSRMKELHALLSNGRIGALTSLMRGVVSVDGGLFDQQPDLLNVGNGVVDLRTGELLPHNRELLLTRITETNYLPEATHKDWDQTLSALDPDVADWMQVRTGQAATGYPTSDDVLPIGQGSGSNGKSTYLTALFGALGEHIQQVPEKLIRANPNDHPTEVMTLFGARVAVIDETPEVASLNVQRLKAVLGQEWMTARAIRKDNVTWRATHSLFVMTNYIPNVRETDHGTWRRLALVKFDKTFPRDDKFRSRMQRGAAGRKEAVLAWIVAGARRWYENERVIPEAPTRVQTDTRAWRVDSDLVLSFLGDAIEFDPASCIMSTDLRDQMNLWLELHGHAHWSEKLLSARFAHHEELQKHNVKKAEERNPKGLVRLFGSNEIPSRAKVWRGMRWRYATKQ